MNHYSRLLSFSRGSLAVHIQCYKKRAHGLRSWSRWGMSTFVVKRPYTDCIPKAITSIAVHPTNVHLICTTSRDYTTRVYDLRLDVVIEVPRARAAARRHADFKAANPNWFPEMKPSLAGAAHGLRLPDSEREGSGKGRCVCVLMGGRAGGHTAAVSRCSTLSTNHWI